MRSPHRTHLLARLRFQILGLIFLLVVALFFVVTIGMYNKAFTDVALVTLETDQAGNQMRPGADVKVRGMVVGEVREISSRGRGASLELALDPKRLDVIPADVSARLLPKTLFGERYVSLVPPKGTNVRQGTHLVAGSVIGQDRSRNAIELERVFDNLMPLLQAVEPQKLAGALGAVAAALEGRGKQLGETLVEFSAYLKDLNPSLPDFTANLEEFVQVADTYNKAAPELIDAMATFTTTSRTLVQKQDNLRDLYAAVTTASDDLSGFFRVNRTNLITLTTRVQSTLDVLAKYAPQYPCMLTQLAGQIPEAERAFGLGDPHPQVSKVTIEIIASRGAYEPGVDEPEYRDQRGPRCYTPVKRPGHWPQYPPDGPIDDGSSKPPPGHNRGGEAAEDYEDFDNGASAGGSALGTTGVGNSFMESELVSLLAAPALGERPSDVPRWSSLLLGPLYRGAEVELR